MSVTMDDARVVYVNTQAEGAKINPQELNDQNIAFAANLWKRNKSVIHVKLMGIRKIQVGDIVKEVLIGNIGVANIYLPVDKAALAANQDPLSLTRHLVAVTVEAVDMQDEGNRVLFVNRETALETLKHINANRLKAGVISYGVIQRVIRGAYIMNVGGELAYLPRSYYDHDRSKLAKVGEEFQVLILPDRESRRRQNILTKPLETVPAEPTTGQVGKTLGEIREAVMRGEKKEDAIAVSTEPNFTSNTIVDNETDASEDGEEIDPNAAGNLQSESVQTTRQRFMVVSRKDLIPNSTADLHFEPGTIVVGRITGFTKSGRAVVEVSKNAFVTAGGFFGIHRTPMIGELVDVKISNTRSRAMFGNVIRVIDDSSERLIAYRQ